MNSNISFLIFYSCGFKERFKNSGVQKLDELFNNRTAKPMPLPTIHSSHSFNTDFKLADQNKTHKTSNQSSIHDAHHHKQSNENIKIMYLHQDNDDVILGKRNIFTKNDMSLKVILETMLSI